MTSVDDNQSFLGTSCIYLVFVLI